MVRTNIAIVDDDQLICEQLKENLIDLCEELFLNYSIDLYNSGHSLLESCKKYDLVILDVEMENGNGIETKNELTQLYQPIIIFLSNYQDKVLEAFGENVVAYLDKSHPQLMKEIEKYFRLYMNKRYMIIENQCVLLDDIYYLQADGSYTHIYTNEKEYIVRKNLKDIETEVSGSSLYRIHKSYIVNFKYVEVIKQSEIVLTNQMKLHIARRKVNDIQQLYITYIRSGVS